MRLLEALRWARSGIRAGMAMEKSTGAEALADQLFRLGFSPDPPGGGVVNPFTDHATSYRAIQAFARNVAATQFELYRAGTDDLVEDGPVRRLLDRPNPLMRGTQLFEALTIDLEASGNGLWWYGPAFNAPSGQRIPASIRRLDPSRTKVRLGEGDAPVLYEFTSKTGTVKLPAEDISHFKYWNPSDEAWGMSWTNPAAGEIELDVNAGRWERGFFRRGAEPGAVLMPDGEGNISEPTAERIRQSWIARHSGVGRSHAPAILPKGLKLERTGIGQRDMDFVNGRRFSREQTLSTAGVPPAIAGILEYANYANMMPQLRIFFLLELIPRLAYIEDVIQADLLDRFKTGLEGYFKTETIMALVDEIGTKSEVAVRLSSIGVPLTLLNERLELGFDLTGVEGADQPRAPMAAAPPGAPTPEPGPQDPPKPPSSDQTDDEEDPSKTIRLLTAPKRYHRPQLGAIWRALVGYTKDLESQADSRWRDHLKTLQDETLRAITAIFPKAAVGPRAVTKDETAPKDPRSSLVFEIADANQEVIIRMEPVWRQAMARGARTVTQQTGIAIDFSFVDPKVLAALANRRQVIRETNERIAADLRETLAEGLGLGESEADLKDRVRDFFGGERANSRTVARTETFGPFSEGRFAAMQQAGIKRHSWLTAEDTRVRDSHEAVDGQEVIIGDVFPNGLRYPHDPTGAAGEVINCRCVTLPVVA